ncbi:hypothetical protein [Bradyrhizobium aeschynomenes]|uniref:hypothetical protein n=1 Tax=Bradyrhizobium aeschynomenes TaxID=2734909 RepID=UPI001552C6E7|nr:hypothetical protein [Bradyrhizobium aeschynomenes]NPV22637.1 hypothetical protein [Bradyrhizobium aeschynomenes]
MRPIRVIVLVGALTGVLMLCGVLILEAFSVQSNVSTLALMGGVAGWLAVFIVDRFRPARAAP